MSDDPAVDQNQDAARLSAEAEAIIDELLNRLDTPGKSAREMFESTQRAAEHLGVDIPQGLAHEDVVELHAAMNSESDRGCALLAASFLDERLGELLKTFFVDEPSVAKDLLEGTGGLATFSARIDLAYLLGLIPPVANRDLHLIRKIRNDFAHVARDLGFDHPPIASRCAELGLDILGERLPPRRKFRQVVLGTCGAIDAALHNAQHRHMRKGPHFDARLQDEVRRLADQMAREQQELTRPHSPPDASSPPTTG